jgi:hypothetical protein
MNVAAHGTAIDIATSWIEANQRYLMNALAVIRNCLDQRGARPAGDANLHDQPAASSASADAAKAMATPPAIDTLATTFNLSAFERDVLLLCAGVELDTGFAASCAAALGDPNQNHPTFALALSVLPDPHWSAISPAGPLRHFRLIEMGGGGTVTGNPLHIDERVLHHLVGEPYLDERLAGFVEPVWIETGELVPSHRAIASRITAAWKRAPSWGSAPIIQLWGTDEDGKRAIAAAVCADIGARLFVLPAQLLGGGQDELTLARLLSREAALGGAALVVECENLDAVEPFRLAVVSRLVGRITGPVFVTSRERARIARRPSVLFEVAEPIQDEQRALWAAAIGTDRHQSASSDAPDSESLDLATTIDRLVSQFDLSASAIESASFAAFAEPDAAVAPARALWDACRSQARPRLDDLAHRIDVGANWDDLVLPEVQRNLLREIALHVRQRSKVYGTWGFASKGARGLGVSALFTGASGTGKTMAAEVLAATLQLDLYLIDLSRVVSKYIGESEKNLRRVFDAAEEGAAILLFDEADAIFGKRSEVKDSHDRYANMEVSYLLQRMESYRGLAILTTNMKSALDTAFLRRIRFVVQFPYPEAEQRAAIWNRVFPPGTPTEGLDMQKLARLNVAGGNIRNIAVNAAFLAAEAGGPVRMAEVMRAARSEYAKMERPMTRELEG